MNKRELERMAYHEAGHAVMMHHFGIEIDQISIDPNVDKLAVVKPKPSGINSMGADKDEFMALLKECVIPSLGGLASEFIHDGEHKTKYVGSGDDLKKTQELLRALNIVWSYQYIIEWLFNDAVELLKDKWGAVEALSWALIQKRTIVGELATKIIEMNIPRRKKKGG